MPTNLPIREIRIIRSLKSPVDTGEVPHFVPHFVAHFVVYASSHTLSALPVRRLEHGPASPSMPPHTQTRKRRNFAISMPIQHTTASGYAGRGARRAGHGFYRALDWRRCRSQYYRQP